MQMSDKSHEFRNTESTNDAEHLALANMTAAVERRVEHMHELIEQSFDDLRAGIRDDISLGFQDALRHVAKDSDFARPFWERGFDQMMERAAAQGSQWVGKRILTAIIGAALVATITWMVASGRFK